MADQPVVKIKSYAPGSTVIVQNSVNKGYFYIVKSGTLSIDSEHRLQDKVLSRFEAGDSFGLVSALTGHKFLVTVYADTEASVIEIPVKMLGTYLKSQKDIAVRMLSLYTKELRAVIAHLSRANVPQNRNYHPDNLMRQAEVYQRLGREKYASYALHTFVNWAEKQPDLSEKLNAARAQLGELGYDYDGPDWSEVSAELPKDEILFLENEASDELYIVKEGSVRLFKLIRDQEYIIEVLEPGEMFGEMSIIDHTVRMASAVTDSDSVILRYTKESLFDSVGEVILQKIFESLARRIWLAHQRVEILRLEDPQARLYAYVYNLIRDHDIKTGQKQAPGTPYQFHPSLDELKTMCGIIRIKDEKIASFLKDNNIIFDDVGMTVKERRLVEDKVAYFRTQSGQITSSYV